MSNFLDPNSSDPAVQAAIAAQQEADRIKAERERLEQRRMEEEEEKRKKKQ
jgi:hypothetical protein